ncbi:VID27-domain-containing protein [Ramicandelaber brevisporus]|nr:VID27-domain-containing protein [Ramicandelaber brevisporus]
MFSLKSLGALIFGEEAGPESAKLRAGQFFVRSKSSSSSAAASASASAELTRRCKFNDSLASITKTSVGFNYMLTVTRVLQDGEEDTLTKSTNDDDDEGGDGLDADDLDDEETFEDTFLISSEIQFRVVRRHAISSTKPEPLSAVDQEMFDFHEDAQAVLLWTDPINAADTVFEFVPDSQECSSSDVNEFERAMWRCMYERRYRKSSKEATSDELARFKYIPPAVVAPKTLSASPAKVKIETPAPATPATPAAAAAAAAEDEEEEEEEDAAVPVKKEEEEEEEKIDAPAAKNIAADSAALPMLADGEVVAAVVGELYLFDPSIGSFVMQSEEAAATIVRLEPSEDSDSQYRFWLNVADNDRPYLAQPLEPELNPTFNLEQQAFVWNYYDDQGRIFSWSMRFASRELTVELQHAVSLAMYESLHQQSFAKAKVDERDFVYNAYQEHAERYPDLAADDEDDDDERPSDESEDEDNEDEDDEDVINTKPLAGEAPDTINSNLAVGYKYDRSFVVRGNKIGVFKHLDDGDEGLEFDTAITNVRSVQSGRTLAPTRIMLHEEDRHMVMLDDSDPHKLYKMDLEVGKVVEEFQVHEHIPTTHMAPISKFAQMTDEKTMVGLSHRCLFKIDPRINTENKVIESQFKAYATRHNFTAAATTRSGQVVVGTAKGEIRMFSDKLGINAKTVLPALGDPIIGLDVTADGRWIVATCKTYLLLIDAMIHSDPNRALGFQKAFPKDDKPVPRRLQLKPEHVAYMGTALSFTPARFNADPDAPEKNIVTSTGPFVVTWNFRRVKQGKLGDYQIKKYADEVVADNFRFGTSGSIVVALPHDVRLASKGDLEAPKKAFQHKGITQPI